MKTYLYISLVLALSLANTVAGNVTLVSQPHSGSGSLYQSSVNGTDYDQMTWDDFRLTNSVAITELRWRGGYLYGGIYSGRVTNWTIAFYRDIANGYQPDIINPPFAIYNITGNAGETSAGIFGGTTMYDYSFTLPNPFQAVAGSNYWLLIQANQAGIPEWGTAMGQAGNGKCFRRIAGMADWYFYIGSGDLSFSLFGSDGPTATILATASPGGSGEILGSGAYPIGSTAALTARPASGYGFVDWEENGTIVSASSIYQLAVSTNRNLLAVFTPRYAVTSAASPTYGGTATGGGTYNSNALVTVIATPASGYSFVNWTEFGVPVSADPGYSFNISGSRNLVANFAPSAATAVFDFDSGMPPVSPHQGLPGSQWNNGITALFGTLSGGWSIQNTFYGWVPGVFSGNFLYPSTWGSTLTITFSQPITNITIAYATGDVSSEYDVPTTVRITGYTNANANSAVATGTAKGGWLTGAYPEGTMSVGSTTPFSRVIIDMPSGQSPAVSYILFVDNIVVSGVPQPPVNITANVVPAEGGSVTGAGLVANGATVSLTAIPFSGYNFVEWTENGVSVCATPVYDFVATSDRTLVANFTLLAPTSTIITTVSPSNAGVSYGDGIYTNGVSANVSAVHNTGYVFVNWTENGTPVSSLDSFSFMVTGNRLLVANFDAIVIPTLTIRPQQSSIVLSWSTNSVGFTLQQLSSIGGTNWLDRADVPALIDANYVVTIPATNNTSFFRLTHP